MSGDLVKVFGLVISSLRQSRSWSQELLAEEAGIDRSFLSQIETGRKQPSLLTIFRLARAFGTEPSHLLQQTESRLREMNHNAT